MTDDSQRRLTPRLRFPEFRDGPGWKEEPMDAVYSFRRSNSLSREKLNYERGTVKNIHYGDIHTKFSTLFDITKETVPYINPAESLAVFRTEDDCVEGDVVFADASEDLEGIGKCIEVVRLNGERVVSGLHTILARPVVDSLTIGFGGHLFESRRVRAQIQKESQGAKVLGMSATRLSRIRLPIPHTKDEQKKIADCLSSLDELIGAEARKLDQLEAHKRGLMQRLFPREGEARPRLRFPEFRGAPNWDHQPLGDLEDQQRLEIGRGNVISHKDLRTTPGNHPVYSSSAVGDGCMGRYGLFMFDEEMISWSIDGGGRFFYRPKHRFSVTNVCGYMRMLDESLVCRFVAYQLQCLHARETFDYQLKAHPSVIRKLYRLAIPSTREQERIASSLSTLDDLIVAQGCKLEALKTHRRGLMQQLFPSQEDGP